MGSSFRQTIFTVLGIEPGAFLRTSSIAKDIGRLKKAEKASQQKAKERRKKMKFQKTSKSQKRKKAEGMSYASGAFNEMSEK